MEPETDTYRLLSGDFEGIKGLVAERYGPAVVLQDKGTPLMQTALLRSIARWYCDTLDVDAVYVRRLGKDGCAAVTDLPTAPCASKPLVGRPVPGDLDVRECGLKYLVRPLVGSSAGLFLDHRDNRSRIRSMAEGKTVLNLFAYTCGFSVAAAAGGAGRTVSVDLSDKNLEWGRNNFRLNGLDTTRHEFVRADAAEYLRRVEKQGERFDLIILDPPTFSHGRKRGRNFSVARDLGGLVCASLSRLEPGGVMMISTNYRRMSVAPLREQVKQGAGRRRFRGQGRAGDTGRAGRRRALGVGEPRCPWPCQHFLAQPGRDGRGRCGLLAAADEQAQHHD
jgi:23S rRNA (cytosine1962-C5)-methyltransferase